MRFRNPLDLIKRLFDSSPSWRADRYLARRYQATFGTPEGKEVLGDLSRFCHAYETTEHPEAIGMALAEGRRQVLLHILTYVELDITDLMELAARYQGHEQNAISGRSEYDE